MKDKGLLFLIAVVLLSGLLLNGNAAAQYLFDDPVNYPSGAAPVDVAAGDFDVDGSLDLACVDELQGMVNIFMNRGDGKLTEHATLQTGSSPQCLESGLIDGDAFPDIVVSNHSSGTVSVFMGRGDGTFDGAVDYSVQNGPRGLCIADLNGDSHQDVVVVNHDSGNVSVLLNNGAGILHLSGNVPSGGSYTHPSWVAAADLDQDGDRDLIVTKNYFNLYFTAGYVEIFFNDGSGDFTSVQILDVENTVSTPMAVDVDQDQDVDVVVPASGSSYYAAVLRNPGNGILDRPELYYSGASGRGSSGDVDGDGDVDLIISRTGVYASSFTVVFNDGNGVFGDAYTESVGDQPRGSVLADLDGDGDPEAAVAVRDEGRLSVLFNTTFQLPLSLAVFSDLSHYQGGDLLSIEIEAESHTGSALQVQFWSEGEAPGGTTISPISGPVNVTVPPYALIPAQITLRLPAAIPPGGPYLYRVNVGTYPNDILVQDVVSFFVDP